MDFNKMLKPASKKSVFRDEKYFVWCGTTVRGDDGLYYFYYSRWPRQYGHQGWVIASEVAYAYSDSPLGPFVPKGVALAGSGKKDGWDRDCIHNPMVKKFDGKYYLYYMGNYGNGEYWDHRNHQRVGVAIAENPCGPWKRFDQPVIDVTPGSFDHLMTSNPTVEQGKDGRYYAIYKAVGDGPFPKGGPVICGVAISDSPLGPFVKEDKPIMINPENNWSVEDPYIWYQDDRFYALVKDFQGYFTKRGKNTVALFESKNGIDWEPAEIPFAFETKICWEDGKIQNLTALERPQLLIENGKPTVLYCAAAATENREDSFNVAIPLEIK